MKAQVMASDIAVFLQKELVGTNVTLEKPSVITEEAQRALMFAKKYSEQIRDVLNRSSCSMVIAHSDYAGHLSVAHVISDNPRLDYALSVQRFFAPPPEEGISPLASVHPAASLGKGVFVGDFSVLEENVEIGDGTYIGSNVVISKNVTIGCNCVIKSSSVLGQRGFGFEYNKDGIPVALPHLGSVRIGNDVEIGANCTVVAGTIVNTVIADHVKTDDHVHIAHNVQIDEATEIAGGAVLSGSVRVGHHVWIGPNCSVIDSAKIGDGAFLGIGCVVIKDVPPNKVVVGNPGRILRDVKKPV